MPFELHSLEQYQSLGRAFKVHVFPAKRPQVAEKRDPSNSWFSKFKRIAFSSTVYHIWTARNRFIFEGLPAIAECIIHRIKTSVYRAMFALYPQALVQLEALAIDR